VELCRCSLCHQDGCKKRQKSCFHVMFF
jgi:hypothetical protein